LSDEGGSVVPFPTSGQRFRARRGPGGTGARDVLLGVVRTRPKKFGTKTCFTPGRSAFGDKPRSSVASAALFGEESNSKPHRDYGSIIVGAQREFQPRAGAPEGGPAVPPGLVGGNANGGRVVGRGGLRSGGAPSHWAGTGREKGPWTELGNRASWTGRFAFDRSAGPPPRSASRLLKTDCGLAAGDRIGGVFQQAFRWGPFRGGGPVFRSKASGPPGVTNSGNEGRGTRFRGGRRAFPAGGLPTSGAGPTPGPRLGLPNTTQKAVGNP